MYDVITLANLQAYSLQLAGVVLVASFLPAALRIQAPGIRYAYWRAIGLLCVALPWIQQRRITEQPVHTPPLSPPLSTMSSTEGTLSLAPSSADWGSVIVPLLLVGGLVRLVWLMVGFMRLRRLRDSGVAATEEIAETLQQQIGTRASIRYVPMLWQPVTFGVRHPVVLLPEGLRTQGDDIKSAVLAHELWHVRRRDWAWVVGEELVRCLLWFHPAMWWVIARIRLAREEFVDALAVSVIGQRLTYVRALVAFADETPLAPAPAFAWRRHLFHRILLLSREDVMSARRLVVSCAAMALIVLVVGWFVVGRFPLVQNVAAQDLQTQAGPLELSAKPAGPDLPVPRRVHDVTPEYPSDPAARQMSVRVTVRATIDHAGSVAEARSVGFEFATEHLRAAIRDGEGMANMKLLLDRARIKIGPGKEAVSSGVQAPVLESFVQAAVTAVQQWQYEPPQEAPLTFDVTIHFAGETKAETTVFAPSQPADGAIRVGQGMSPPRKIHDVQPIYPPRAREAEIQGVVSAEIRIESDGKVAAARILRSIPLLDDAAINAIKQWKFEPTLMNGVPTPVIMVVTVQFRLE